MIACVEYHGFLLGYQASIARKFGKKLEEVG